jgi:hypothetical protein
MTAMGKLWTDPAFLEQVAKMKGGGQPGASPNGIAATPGGANSAVSTTATTTANGAAAPASKADPLAGTAATGPSDSALIDAGANRKMAAPVAANPAPAQPQVAPPAGKDLPKKAKVIKLGATKVQYDFGRPITREQAAKVLFVDGKVPSQAKLTQGPGDNSWTLSADDLDSWQETLNKMRGRKETITPGKQNSTPGHWNPPDPDDVTDEWSDEPSKPSPPKRRDLDNKLGFKIVKHYKLDPGKSPAKLQHVIGGGAGEGFELRFDKEVTSDEVMKALFASHKFQDGDVQLQSLTSKEPSTLWEAHIIGIAAIDSLKREASDAIGDANQNAAEDIPPDVPNGMRDYFEKKAVPSNAIKHGANVYTWEQEGYLAYVVSDGKGHYDPEATAIQPGEYDDGRTIRYFILKKGLAPGDAWKAYSKHWEELHRMMILALIGFYGAAPTGVAGLSEAEFGEFVEHMSQETFDRVMELTGDKLKDELQEELERQKGKAEKQMGKGDKE